MQAVEQPEGRPYPEKEVFHGIVGKIVKHVAPTTEADIMGMVGSLLTGFSAVVGSGPHLMIGRERHRVNVWTLLMGGTGNGKKGTATTAVSDFLKALDEGFWQDRRVTSLSTGEGLIYAVRDASGFEADFQLDDGMQIIMGKEPDPGVVDKRLLVISSEFGSIMAKGGTLGNVLRDAWDGSDLALITKEKAKRATAPHISVLGHITPEEFGDRLKNRDMAGGTYNRFLPLFVHRSQEVPWPEYSAAWEVEAQNLAAELADAARAARKVERIELGDAAKRTWGGGMYQEMSAVDENDPEMLQQFTSRRAAHTLRVAAAYALMNKRKSITKADLLAARAVVMYAFDSARYITKKLAPAKDRSWESAKETLTAHLRSVAPNGMNRTTCMRVLKNNFSTDAVSDLIAQIGAVEKRELSDVTKRVTTMVYLDEAPENEEKGPDMADYGYTRRTPNQVDKLEAAGCVKVFADYAATSPDMRLNLMSCLVEMEAGDRLVICEFTEVSRHVGTAREVLEWLDVHGQEFGVLDEPKWTLAEVLAWVRSFP